MNNASLRCRGQTLLQGINKNSEIWSKQAESITEMAGVNTTVSSTRMFDYL